MSNAALFASKTDPELIKFENQISDENRMYMMKTIGLDCSNQATWNHWLEDGKQVLVGHSIPRALISGDEDGVFPAQSAQTLKRRFEIPDAEFHMLEGVGHIPMLERGEEVAQIIMDFLCLSSGVLECLDRHSRNSSGSERVLSGPERQLSEVDRQSIDADEKSIDAYPYLTARATMEELKQ